MYKSNKKGQSTLEYILLVTAVVAVLIVFLAPRKGKLYNTVNDSYSSVADGMNSMTQKLSNVWQ